MSERGNDSSVPGKPKSGFPFDFKRMFRIEWIGQTVASVCWIISVLVYGGDWLQLMAASSWLVANIATLMVVEAD